LISGKVFMSQKKYVLITAAKNEAAYIEKTLLSVLSQSILPECWVVVNDGSTDATEAIIKSYQEKCTFIHLISRPPDPRRHFGAKAKAVKQALTYLNGCEYTYDYIGNLDADVSFEVDFYKKLIEQMENNASLGIIGGLCHELNNGKWEVAHSNPEWAVGGATHFFRAEVFKKTDGYPPLEFGGEDTVIEYLARHEGYTVTALTGTLFYHHKGRTFSKNSGFSVYFRLGMQEYMWGTSPLFEVFKCISRAAVLPHSIGSAVRFAGFMYAKVVKKHPSIPRDQVNIIRKQQHTRLAADLQKLPGRILKKARKQV